MDFAASTWEFLRSLSQAHAAGITLFSLLVFALDLWAIERACSRGHGVQGTLTWIFAILAFPLVGALAFFALASPSVRRVKLARRRAAAQLRHELGGKQATPDAMQGDSLLDLAANLTGLAPNAGNDVTLLTENEETFARIEKALRGARRFIWAEYYIIQNDETGRRFLEVLAERARAGLEVRLLYDAVGSLHINAERLRQLEVAGGRARAFQPMNPLRRRLSVHLRNHRKLIVVDGEVGFTGGMNVGDEYSGSRRRSGLAVYRDSHLELRGPAVSSLAQAFREDWVFAGGRALPPFAVPEAAETPGSMVAIVTSGPDQEHNASAFVHFAAIASARRRVYLSSPYFIPDEATLAALVSSALRRVDVRVLLPALSISDVKIAAYAARSYYGKLLRGGVRIFEYEPSMLHGKTLVADGQIACVGSANVDLRSYRLNFEIGALINDTRFAATLERRFLRDVAHANEVTLELLARQTKSMRFVCAAARLLSPLL
ncbi:MAG: cardiolipin synthase [Planctomycetes bacterium]|nr:cardiolipin synthase [Planctomycetota bacterium]